MSKNVLLRFNVKRVNKFNTTLLWFLSLLITGQTFLTLGIDYGIRVMICTFSAALVSTLAVFINLKFDKYENATALIISLSVVVGAGIYSIIQRGTYITTIFIVYIGSVAMIALYFRVKLVIIHTILLNLFLVVFYLFDPEGIMGPGYSVMNLMRTLLSMDLILIIIFFFTKWGNEYIMSALDKEQSSNRLLMKLEDTKIP